MILVLVSVHDAQMISRDLGCATAGEKRGKEICVALSQSMEWTWTGHAIVSPGWRVTWKALRRVYCRAKIGAADLPALESLKKASDWRLRDGAADLIRLERSREGRSDEPETSIFNPKNPEYLLRHGCADAQP